MRALIGGDHHIEIEHDDFFGTARFSTAEEASEAAATILEIAERGGPAASLEDLEEWEDIIERYAYFFERYEPGEELFYYVY
jgi:hypothetical protein